MTLKGTGILILVTLFLSACGGDAGESGAVAAESSPRDGVAGEMMAAAQDPAPEAVVDEPALSDFLTEELHDVEPAGSGTFRIDVAGEVHEGELETCWAREGNPEDRFEARALWQSEDGRAFHLQLRRLLRNDEFFWGRSQGDEFDQVSLRLHDGSGHFELQDQYAASGLQVWRDEPGANPIRGQGSGELPVLRVARDGETGDLRVTALGELEVGEEYGSTNYGTPLTGPFTLAMRCPGEA